MPFPFRFFSKLVPCNTWHFMSVMSIWILLSLAKRAKASVPLVAQITSQQGPPAFLRLAQEPPDHRLQQVQLGP